MNRSRALPRGYRILEIPASNFPTWHYNGRPQPETPRGEPMRVLITRPVADYVVNPIKAAGHEVIMPTTDSAEQTAAIVNATKDFHGIIPMLTNKIDGAFL